MSKVFSRRAGGGSSAPKRFSQVAEGRQDGQPYDVNRKQKVFSKVTEQPKQFEKPSFQKKQFQPVSSQSRQNEAEARPARKEFVKHTDLESQLITAASRGQSHRAVGSAGIPPTALQPARQPKRFENPPSREAEPPMKTLRDKVRERERESALQREKETRTRQLPLRSPSNCRS
eukprot:TRINITY_DN2259_c0_g1_i1.p1 TRINITY_DN2259_c0_g1~~TRINITY_DN2259_c0_g1_i1.p1  ORF type:complete len:174 (+),score=16.06 TRINITY_DN2259_c0_g1_i1:146-667(+)